MKIYKVTTKKDPNQPFWDDGNLLVVAASYANAEDKVKNFYANSEIVSIEIAGETTQKNDVFKLRR